MGRARIDVHQHVLPPAYVAWPFAPEITVQWFTTQLDAYDGLDAAGHVGVERTNAEALFPRFATHKEVP